MSGENTVKENMSSDGQEQSSET